MNPDLLNPTAGNQLSVPKLAAITAPMPNTEATAVYFHCAMATASFHRQDGKKLPFLNHFFKATFAEDIAYLDNEVRQGNPYIRRASEEEVNHAKLLEDPMGTVREQVKKELSIEELEKMLAERRIAVATNPPGQSDASKVAGVDKKVVSDAVKAQGVQNHAAATGANTANLAALLGKHK